MTKEATLTAAYRATLADKGELRARWIEAVRLFQDWTSWHQAMSKVTLRRLAIRVGIGQSASAAASSEIAYLTCLAIRSPIWTWPRGVPSLEGV